jgi:Spy/CpxP family protein refolding chaperone
MKNGGNEMKKSTKVIIVVAIIGLVGYAATSFAGWGRGGGGGYCGGQGGRWMQRGNAAFGNQGNLSDQDIDKLNQERQAFFNETSELGDTLYQKELELRSELAKKDPDATKAVAIQKEISDLESQLAQKRVEHRIQMKKENPELFSGRGYGYGYGGRGKGRGMGAGFGNRGGGCWY